MSLVWIRYLNKLMRIDIQVLVTGFSIGLCEYRMWDLRSGFGIGNVINKLNESLKEKTSFQITDGGQR